MGTIKATNIEPIADNGTVTLGGSGDTLTVSSGATLNVSGTPGTGIRMKPFFKVYKSANTNLSSATATLVTHNGVIYNADSVYDTSTGKFTVPSGEGGYYFLNALTRITGSSTNTFNYATNRFYLNGSSAEYLQHSYTSSGGNFNNDQIPLSTVMELSAGDEVQVYITLSVSSGTPILVGSGSGTSGTVTRFEGFKLIGV
tara:strand:- start:1315 stop:1914 length:600 start_codon:yes stop_codon:yes gene_type:complete